MTERNGRIRDEDAVRTPPHDLYAEKSVIGAILMSNEALDKVIPKLKAEDFYSEKNRIIYRVAKKMYQNQVPVDHTTVRHELNKLGEEKAVGGRQYLMEIVDSVPVASNAEAYMGIVRSKALLREIIDVAARVSDDAFREPDDALELLDSVERRVYALTSRIDEGAEGLKAVGDLYADVMSEISAAYEMDGSITGIPTGLVDLDKLTGGWQKKDLVVLGARPSMGKTAFVLGAAHFCAEVARNNVAIFSLEMGRNDLLKRMLSTATGISLESIRYGTMNDLDLKRLIKEISNQSKLPIFVDDDSGATVSKMRSRLRRLQNTLRNQGQSLDLVIVDYLQLMVEEGRHENRNTEISKISRGLKLLATELDVPVILLSQLSRAVDARFDKKPLLSDLRDSGAVEQDADLVLFLYREDYYDDESERKNIAEALVRKHRNGPLGTVELLWSPQVASFKTLDVYNREEV